MTGSTPQRTVRINSATVFTDTENGVLRLSAPAGFTGSSTVTVTATIHAAGKLDVATPILAMAVEDWAPFKGLGLGLDDVLVREAELSIAPNGGTIGSRVYDIDFGAKFVATIFDTDVRFVGVFNQFPPAIKLEAYVSDFEVAGIGITGAGPDGSYEDGVDNGTPESADPDADNGAYFKLEVSSAEQSLALSGRINLPGKDESGKPAFIAVDGAFDLEGVVLDGEIANWEVQPDILVVNQDPVEGLCATVGRHGRPVGGAREATEAFRSRNG